MSLSSIAGGLAKAHPQGFRGIANAALSGAADAASGVIDDLADSLNDVAENGGIKGAVMVEVVRATISGRNPVWAAVRGAWGAMSVGAQIATVLVIILVLLLAPVVALLAALGLLVAAIVSAVRSSQE